MSEDMTRLCARGFWLPLMDKDLPKARNQDRPPRGQGLCLPDWTAERLQELEELLCAKPFRRDPLRSLADGDDWIGWKMRGEILRQPAAHDEALRERLARESLTREVFQGQTANGSWSDSPLKTAYGILRALSVDVSPDDPRMRRPAEYLLAWPEPAGRPGM